MSSRGANSSKPCWARRVLWSFAALVVTTAAALAWLGLSYWDSALQRHRALEAELRDCGGLRQPLYGESTAGDAYGEYGAILAELREQHDTDVELFSLHAGSLYSPLPDLTPDVRERLTAYGPLLERLRAAAQRESCTPPGHSLAGGACPRWYDWFALHRAIDLLAVSARRRAQDADMRGSLGDVATALQLSLDASRAPDGYVSRSGAMRSLEHLKPVLGGPHDDVLLRSIESLLARLEGEWRGPKHEVDAFEFEVGHNLILDSDDRFFGRVGGGWLLEQMQRSRMRAHGALRDLPHQPWDRASESYSQYSLWTRRSWSVFDGIWQSQLRNADHGYRCMLAQLRLLRAAARLRLGKGPDSPGWPLDPFTLAPLPCRAYGGHAHIGVTRNPDSGRPTDEICVPTR